MLPVITVEGRLGDDPTLRFAPSGVAVASFNIVCNDRKKNESTGQYEDVNPTWFKCTAFRTLAENIAESLKKGDLVIVVGKQQQEKYTNRDGEERTSYQNILVNTCGPSLVFATARVQKAERSSAPAETPTPAPDPWATPAPGVTPEDPPF